MWCLQECIRPGHPKPESHGRPLLPHSYTSAYLRLLKSKSIEKVMYLGVVAGRECRAAAVAQEDLADTVDSDIQSVVGQVAVVGIQHDQMDRCTSAPIAFNSESHRIVH